MGLVFLFGLFAVPAFALTPQANFSDAAAGLEISPVVVELNGQPGGSYIIKEKVHNVTKGDLSYMAAVNDFGAKDETGTPKLLPAGSLPTTASMINWVNHINDFTLKAGETRTLSISVTIPNNAEPGGHYGAIEFQGKDPNLTGNAVGLKVSTSMLVLVRVAGAIDEDLRLASFTSEKDGKQSSIVEDTPITFVVRLQNKGNIHVKPTGTITITDIFGRQVETIKVNAATSNVLPNSIRRFESTLQKDWMFGRYTAELTMGYGTKGQVIQGQMTFWVIPWKIVATIVLILITLGFIVWRLIRVYNRHIINKYKQSNEKPEKKSKKHKS